MSNSFVNSQLFSNGERKESLIKSNIHLFAYYSTILEGKITYSEWLELSPKEREYAIESLDEIREIQKETFANKQKNLKQNQ